MIECEQCGKTEHKAKMKNTRFCSIACARLEAATATSSTTITAASGNATKSLAVEEQDQHVLDQISNIKNNNNNSNNINEANNNDKCNIELQQQQQQPQLQHTVAPIICKTQQQQQQQRNDLNQLQQQQQQQQQQCVAGTTATSEISQIANWSVADVCDFIKNLPGCCDYVDDFEQQEIDGQALLLLKENHLVNAMGMKLGPALKIVAKVEAMKEINNPAVAATALANSDKDA